MIEEIKLLPQKTIFQFCSIVFVVVVVLCLLLLHVYL